MLNNKYIGFDCFKDYNLIAAYSTRFGGVSEGSLESLNFSFNRGDRPDNVYKNFEIYCNSLGIDINYAFRVSQVHGNNVVCVSKESKNKIYSKSENIKEADALITKEKGVALCTTHADCTPVYIYDPVCLNIGMVHSGWKGTLKQVTINTINQMNKSFGSLPQDLIINIGPHIKKCCFEIGNDVLKQFEESFGSKIIKYCEKRPNNKYLMSLENLICDQLIEAGVKYENIHKSDICTKCNHRTFFSHRGSLGKSGTACAILMLKE